MAPVVPSSSPRTTHRTPQRGPLKGHTHTRHRLGVACLALDASTQLVGRPSPEGILYTGGRDGLVISWDLGIPTKRRAHRYGIIEDAGTHTRRWEVMRNWADDVIKEEMDDGEEMRSDGDVLGEVVPRVRKRAIGVATLRSTPVLRVLTRSSLIHHRQYFANARSYTVTG